MANVPTVAPYGTWRTALNPSTVATRAMIADVALGNDSLYWLEWRADNGGHHQIFRETRDGRIKVVTAAACDVQSPAYGGGGKAFCLSGETLYFFDQVTDQVYQLNREGLVEPLTTPDETTAYADFTPDPVHHRLIAVRESQGSVTQRALVGLSLTDKSSYVLDGAHDFYLSPRVSPDGRQLAFVAWRRPDVPWHSSTLYVAAILPDGHLDTPIPVAGGPGEAVSQPVWSPDNRLAFLSDRSGWTNLYLWDGTSVRPITALRSDFGPPPWRSGLATFGFINSDDILATYWIDGAAKLVRIHVRTREMTHWPCPFTTVSQLAVNARLALMVTEADRAARAVTVLDLETQRFRIVHHEPTVVTSDEALSLPMTFTFPTLAPTHYGHGVYYPPCNPDYLPPEGELPPLIVILRNLPIVPEAPVYRPFIHYWTSHGFAVLAPNVRGSHGYGRAVWEQHQGAWGTGDADDVVKAIQFLARHQKADPHRVVLLADGLGMGTALTLIARSDVCRAAVLKLAEPPRFPDFPNAYVDWLLAKADSPDPRVLKAPLAIPILALYHGEVAWEHATWLHPQASSELLTRLDSASEADDGPECETMLRFWARALNIRLAPRIGAELRHGSFPESLTPLEKD
jgi:hypothetical protein